MHVIVDESTLDGTAERAGFIAGHGVVGPEHLRDLARRPDAIIRPLVPTGTPMNPDGTYTLPSHLPSNPYRPSTALDTYVRIRDGLSVTPEGLVLPGPPDNLETLFPGLRRIRFTAPPK